MKASKSVKSKEFNTILKDKKFMVLYYIFFAVFFLFSTTISFIVVHSIPLTIISLSLSILSLIIVYYFIHYFDEHCHQIENLESAKKHDLYIVKWLYGPWFLLPLSWIFFFVVGNFVNGIDAISTTFYVVYTIFLFFYTIYVIVHSYDLKKKFEII